jgi:hypothetical protein
VNIGNEQAGLRQQLAETRARLAEIDSTASAAHVGFFLGAGAVSGIAALAGMLAFLAAATRHYVVAAVFVAPAAGLAVPAVLLWRLALRRVANVQAKRSRLVAAERDLLARLSALDDRAIPVDPPPASPPAAPDPFGADLPPDRQPTRYAQMMWNRFRLGPSPAEALSRLGPDAPKLLVWFHRTVGWGLATAIALALGLLATYAVLAAR